MERRRGWCSGYQREKVSGEKQERAAPRRWVLEKGFLAWKGDRAVFPGATSQQWWVGLSSQRNGREMRVVHVREHSVGTGRGKMGQ